VGCWSHESNDLISPLPGQTIQCQKRVMTSFPRRWPNEKQGAQKETSICKLQASKSEDDAGPSSQLRGVAAVIVVSMDTHHCFESNKWPMSLLLLDYYH